MKKFFNVFINDDAHEVYQPLAKEISKHKNLKLITITDFSGFPSTKISYQIINRILQMYVYLKFSFVFIFLLIFQKNKKFIVREFSNFYLFFLIPLVYIGRNKFLYIVNHNIQIAHKNLFLEKFFMKIIYKVGARFIFFESSKGVELLRSKERISQEIVIPFYINPKKNCLAKEKCDSMIKKIKILKSENNIIISIPGRPSKAKGSFKLIEFIKKFLNKNSNRKYIFIISNELLNFANLYGFYSNKIISPPEDSYKYYETIISESDCAIFNYQKSYYYYRHSGVVLDCLTRGTPVICPNYPLLNNMLNYPVSVGMTYENFEELQNILENKLNRDWLNSIKWGDYIKERSISRVVESIVSKI